MAWQARITAKHRARNSYVLSVDFWDDSRPRAQTLVNKQIQVSTVASKEVIMATVKNAGIEARNEYEMAIEVVPGMSFPVDDQII